MNAATISPSWSSQRTCLVTDYCEGCYSTRPLSKHAVNALRGNCSAREIARHDAAVHSSQARVKCPPTKSIWNITTVRNCDQKARDPTGLKNRQRYTACRINSCHLSTIDQTSIDPPVKMARTLCAARPCGQSEPRRVHSKDHTS